MPIREPERDLCPDLNLSLPWPSRLSSLLLRLRVEVVGFVEDLLDLRDPRRGNRSWHHDSYGSDDLELRPRVLEAEKELHLGGQRSLEGLHPFHPLFPAVFLGKPARPIGRQAA